MARGAPPIDVADAANADADPASPTDPANPVDPGAGAAGPTAGTLRLDLQERRRDLAIAAGVGIVAFAVYLWTLLPGVGYSGDTAKWQFIGKVGGIPHATGYPLYVAIDQAWVRLVPLGSLAWRVNLLSAVFGAAAVAMLYAVLRVATVGRPVAAATALVFAFTGTFWSQAVVAEVYTLHMLLLASVIACLAWWRRGGANAWLLAGMALYAVSFGHHLTTSLALPGVLWLVWSQRQRAVTARNAAIVAAAVLVAAAQYLYLLRLSTTGGYHEARIDNLGDIVSYVTGGSFKEEMFNYSWYGLLVARVPLLWDFVRHEYMVLLVPVALGIWRGLRHSPALRDISIFLLSLGIIAGFYVMEFDVPDVIVFCLPLFLAMAVFLGLGLDGMVTWARERWPDDTRLAPAIAVALIVLVMGVWATDYSRANQRDDRDDARRTEHLVKAAGNDAVLLTDDYHDSEYTWYYLLGEGWGDRHNLALANQVTPSELRAYYARRTGPVALAANRVGLARPPLYTGTAHQALILAAHGFTVTDIAPSVWRVDQKPAAART